MDLATWRTRYAPERSTLVGSLPENAPPPCAPHPPYVSMMICEVVHPLRKLRVLKLHASRCADRAVPNDCAQASEQR